MDETLEKRMIETLPVVISLRFHDTQKKNKSGYRVMHPVMFFFSVSRCDEALCQKSIQLLVQGMVACVRTRSWIPVE